ncbi:MAG: cell division transport system permease protein [Cyclobacteriaceae bacterium]|jgi:cell division transport system permease protein
MRKSSTRKKKLGSYPFVSVVFSIFLSLFVSGLFGIILIKTNSLTRIIKENVEVQVYLNKPIAKTEISRLQKIIGAKRYIGQVEGSEVIRYISREQAAREFLSDTGEDFSEFLGDNPLRDVLIVKINENYLASDSLNMVVSDLESLGGVYEVNYVASLVEKINDNLAKVGAILVGFASLFLLIVIILINNTIKLALYSQRFLIRSMQLVGATSGFINKPFLSRAVMYGAIAGVLAALGLFTVNAMLLREVSDLNMIEDTMRMNILFVVLIVVGVLVAYLSTFTAVRKYLKTSLDELY